MLREIVETVVLTLVIFLLVRTVIQNFRVEGMSMEPNFHDGQFLLINKLAYRLGEPARGDVIVFRYPLDPSRDFIKRVIGLPGETVEIRNGQVLINNQPISDPATVNNANYNMAPVTLGPEEMFVLGDNRPNSSDSHSWGTLPTDHVIGKVVLSYWPPSDWGLIRHGMADPGLHPAGDSPTPARAGLRPCPQSLTDGLCNAHRYLTWRRLPTKPRCVSWFARPWCACCLSWPRRRAARAAVHRPPPSRRAQ